MRSFLVSAFALIAASAPLDWPSGHFNLQQASANNPWCVHFQLRKQNGGFTNYQYEIVTAGGSGQAVQFLKARYPNAVNVRALSDLSRCGR